MRNGTVWRERFLPRAAGAATLCRLRVSIPRHDCCETNEGLQLDLGIAGQGGCAQH
jgi:hypothetical protein